MTVEEFWESFLNATGKSKDRSFVDCYHFELTEKWANELLRLVLIGKSGLQQVVFGHMK